MLEPTSSVTGATIRADAVSVAPRKKNYAEVLKKEYNYRSYIVNMQVNRGYHGERMSPFDPRCVGVDSLHLVK